MTVYEFKPVETTGYTYFWLGADSYIANYCWPGPTPLSTLLDKYPDNPLYAMFMAYGDLNSAFKAAWMGLN